MICTSCAKAIEADVKFCPHCGARQTADLSSPAAEQPTAPDPSEPSEQLAPIAQSDAPAVEASRGLDVPSSPPPAPPPAGKRMASAGAIALVLALASGVGYWGWRTTSEESARKLAVEEQRRVAAEKVAEAAEITAAQALLDKHIAEEEARAQARAVAGVQGPSKSATGKH
ncbi:conserved hypothetical protein [Candidatus Accumulibacter aalborgensis]|uniref:Zinc-ribbon domain-containing protein n=1 Tax=Candidatus Accumulibacter aalborgensis TaxID=1860102 RepID=A0A1A8XZ90_9PROT|nr:zinc ribbon domain-containing protein [Candidatus Accumulibacter aalborgensis]SBT10260.1 conserved hypothetical protein [Candidatus Accumulibacter aalborgensis]